MSDDAQPEANASRGGLFAPVMPPQQGGLMSMRLSRSVVGEAEARAVSRVITEDGYLGMGNEVRLLKKKWRSTLA